MRNFTQAAAGPGGCVKDHSVIRKVSMNDVEARVCLLCGTFLGSRHFVVSFKPFKLRVRHQGEFGCRWWTPSSGRTGVSLPSISETSEDRFSPSVLLLLP